MSLMSLTAVALGKKVQAGEVTVEEAVLDALEQIEKKEDTIHSYVTVLEKEAILEKAKEIQKKIDAGELTGLLAGVPVAIKDNMCTEGVLTTCSSKILYNFVPTYTSEAVKNLEAAGAVIIGKTNMDEFAMGSTTETSAYGITRNPHRDLSFRTDQEPMECRTCTGRFFRWFLCGSCGGGMFLCPWFRYRRFYPPAKFILWCDRNQANVWYGFPLRADCLRFFT